MGLVLPEALFTSQCHSFSRRNTYRWLVFFPADVLPSNLIFLFPANQSCLSCWRPYVLPSRHYLLFIKANNPPIKPIFFLVGIIFLLVGVTYLPFIFLLIVLFILTFFLFSLNFPKKCFFVTLLKLLLL